ncbi:hypothetical protein ACFXDH_08830 [Streptomyces sp. NPDC059467]|uniref:hypothetical protein n=1 Tax=Streptomyces sp. NPDC059467 TaxID=3346844 RepID=UPI00368E5240
MKAAIDGLTGRREVSGSQSVEATSGRGLKATPDALGWATHTKGRPCPAEERREKNEAAALFKVCQVNAANEANLEPSWRNRHHAYEDSPGRRPGIRGGEPSKARQVIASSVICGGPGLAGSAPHSST